jgi:integrase
LAGLSFGRCRQAYHLLAAIMRTAVDDGRIATSPCRGVKLPRLPQVEMSYLEPEQLRALVDAVDGQHGLFVEVLAIAGLRFGEGAALRRSRIDLGRSRLIVAESLSEVSGTLHFVPPKTHQRRTVTLPRFLSERLARHVAELVDDALVFQAPRGGPIDCSRQGRPERPTGIVTIAGWQSGHDDE